MVMLDPRASQEAKDQAGEQLDRRQGSIDSCHRSSDIGGDKPGSFDGQEAARDVVNSGRHTGSV